LEPVARACGLQLAGRQLADWQLPECNVGTGQWQGEGWLKAVINDGYASDKLSQYGTTPVLL